MREKLGLAGLLPIFPIVYAQCRNVKACKRLPVDALRAPPSWMRKRSAVDCRFGSKLRRSERQQMSAASARDLGSNPASGQLASRKKECRVPRKVMRPIEPVNFQSQTRSRGQTRSCAPMRSIRGRHIFRKLGPCARFKNFQMNGPSMIFGGRPCKNVYFSSSVMPASSNVSKMSPIRDNMVL